MVLQILLFWTMFCGFLEMDTDPDPDWQVLGAIPVRQNYADPNRIRIHIHNTEKSISK
jgi:hypothetical protein